MEQKEPMTKFGFQRLSDELNKLKNIDLPAVNVEIDRAKENGDLKENSEYHAAREQQAFIGTRIAELGDVISRAQIVDPSELEHARISFGSTVVLCDLSTDDEITYTIVGGIESNPDRGLISFNSPLAKQLLGREEGDEVKARLPGGEKTFEILEVKYQEIVFETH
ncbi:MAG: transcription elongation factor GreA [Sulfuricurvum sp.]|nr:transcription elongation factor GreA [Sulfuricurvum sp.]